MKIKWIGKYSENNLPSVEVEVGTQSLPEVTTKSAVMLIPILLIFALCVYCKRVYLGGIAFSRVAWMIGIFISLLFFPVHELLHAICFSAGSQVFMFYTMQGLGITCTTPHDEKQIYFCKSISVNDFRGYFIDPISGDSMYLCFCKYGALCL